MEFFEWNSFPRLPSPRDLAKVEMYICMKYYGKVSHQTITVLLTSAATFLFSSKSALFPASVVTMLGFPVKKVNNTTEFQNA